MGRAVSIPAGRLVSLSMAHVELNEVEGDGLGLEGDASAWLLLVWEWGRGGDVGGVLDVGVAAGEPAEALRPRLEGTELAHSLEDGVAAEPGAEATAEGVHGGIAEHLVGLTLAEFLGVPRALGAQAQRQGVPPRAPPRFTTTRSSTRP